MDDAQTLSDTVIKEYEEQKIRDDEEAHKDALRERNFYAIKNPDASDDDETVVVARTAIPRSLGNL